MYEDLMEEALQAANVETALRAVVKNKGAPGIDRMTVDKLEEHLERHWSSISAKLLQGSYAPSPVKRVEIEKPGGGTRVLGIPTALDRFVQQLLLQAMTPIFDPMFSEYSYGFRPKRGAHQAVRTAKRHVESGKTVVVDVDISKFFDHVNHDILMGKIGKVIRDKRALKLIGKFLRAGMMQEGVVTSRAGEGTPQGGPLSPLLANIYLDELDKELEHRGHCFSRYADDCNVYVSSEAAAKRVLASMTTWLENKLRLQVNQEKSGIGRPWERQFLGFTITEECKIRVSDKALTRLKSRVRELWNALRSRTTKQLRDDWQRYVRGWWQYYKLADDRRMVSSLSGWTRRHMRKCFWLRWHCTAGRRNALRRLGITDRRLKLASNSRGAWHLARNPTIHAALSNKTLNKYGFTIPWELAD